MRRFDPDPRLQNINYLAVKYKSPHNALWGLLWEVFASDSFFTYWVIASCRSNSAICCIALYRSS
jgi:hypothetical protein